jgi:hypothetical protein
MGVEVISDDGKNRLDRYSNPWAVIRSCRGRGYIQGAVKRIPSGHSAQASRGRMYIRSHSPNRTNERKHLAKGTWPWRCVQSSLDFQSHNLPCQTGGVHIYPVDNRALTCQRLHGHPDPSFPPQRRFRQFLQPRYRSSPRFGRPDCRCILSNVSALECDKH